MTLKLVTQVHYTDTEQSFARESYGHKRVVFLKMTTSMVGEKGREHGMRCLRDAVIAFENYQRLKKIPYI